MDIELLLSKKTIESIEHLYSTKVEKITFEKTNPDFQGDLTLVVFPFLKISKKKPEDTANEIGKYLQSNLKEIESFNVVKGFLNIVISNTFWLEYFSFIYNKPIINTTIASNAPKVLVEYSSPNTNKPLHLGHIRNNLLGYSVAEILKAAGNDVVKVNLVNDRGIHICKSMLAWQKWGNGETPESNGMKGDHLVGKYYVEFDKEFKKQLKPIIDNIYQKDFHLFNEEEKEKLINLLNKTTQLENVLKKEVELIDFSIIAKYGFKAETLAESAYNENIKWKTILKCFEDEEYRTVDVKIKEQKQKELSKILKSVISIEEKIDDEKSAIKDIAQNKTPIMLEIQDMLRKWEAGDKEVRALWEMMNGWVYKGFESTYKMLGVDFDKTYYESNTYLLGKDLIEQGLQQGVLKRRTDNSVFIDLTADGLDEKTLLRGDGTSVYITQDLGTAVQRAQEYNFSKLIYTVGNEQDYHFKVLFLILQKLGYTWAKGLFHLSYGMVELPEGKMKSREGTVVDADDLMQEMVDTAAAITQELGKAKDLTEEESKKLYHTIGMGALKYFMLKIDPKKKMLFNPAESIDFNGNTAPFIQFNYVRIQAMMRKATEMNISTTVSSLATTLLPKEKELIIRLYSFNTTLQSAANEYSPAIIANYTYDLAKEYSQYYHDTPILKETEQQLKIFRIQLSKTIGEAIKAAMKLLGIEVPERM